MELQTDTYRINFERLEGLLAMYAIENQEYKRAAEERNKEAEKRFKELERLMDKSDKKLTTLSELYNGFAKNTGEAVEAFFYEHFVEKPVVKGIHFQKVVHQMRSADAEYDIVLTNGEYVAIIEVKHKFHPKDLLKFVEVMLPKFKTEFPNFAHCKVIAGVASYVFPEETKELALQHGLYIFTQSGENVKIANSRNFVPTYY